MIRLSSSTRLLMPPSVAGYFPVPNHAPPPVLLDPQICCQVQVLFSQTESRVWHSETHFHSKLQPLLLVSNVSPQNGQHSDVFNLLQRLVASTHWARRDLPAASALVAHVV